jgi:hypothetical protein
VDEQLIDHKDVYKMPLKYLMCLVVLLTGISALADNPTPVIREEHKVVEDGVEEHWRLEWASPPSPAVGGSAPGKGARLGDGLAMRGSWVRCGDRTVTERGREGYPCIKMDVRL